MHSEKVWKLKTPSPGLADRLAFDTGLSPLLAQLLINRGISDQKSADAFLNLRLTDIIDPMRLKGMDAALGLVWNSIVDQRRITIFGDYDADGLTAAALLVNFFSSLGIPVSHYIPNRLCEGYSLNKRAVEHMHATGTGLIITVDCGSSNEEEISFARGLGMEVVVTDHHQVAEGFDPICPLINPHQPGCSFPFKELAGVGVAFFLAIALRSLLRDKGWFKNRPEPDLREYLDLVALGTVADRVPLLGQNRLLVTSGMGCMAETRWPGIKSIKEVADIQDDCISAEDLAFRLGPRLNAPGRIDSAEIIIQILTTSDLQEAKDLALQINNANSRRQNIERGIFDCIEGIIEADGGIGDRRTLFMGAGDWHRGVLGIVASKLVDKYYRPSLIFCTQEGVAVGSGRSIDGFDLFRILGRWSHLFEKFGGHSHAAGFTIKSDHLKTLENELESSAREVLSNADLVPAIDIDKEILLDDITQEMIEEVRSISPFGEGNPEPSFLARSLEVLESRVVGGNHLKLRVRQGRDGKVLDGIGFGMGNGSPLKGKRINMVFTPEMNRWQGYESVQLRMVDLKVEASE